MRFSATAPVLVLALAVCAAAEPILLDVSIGPYLSLVRGTQNASHACLPFSPSIQPTLLDPSSTLPSPPTHPLPSGPPPPQTPPSPSQFTPGGSAPQLGFRRMDLIAQPPARGANRTAFNDGVLDAGLTAFHFSMCVDEARPLNFAHEYQAVWIEPDDGSHVFDLQIGLSRAPLLSSLRHTDVVPNNAGTPCNTTLASPNTLRIRTHNGTPLFSTA
ncbi:hypothetical protein K488DRAFT_92328, partial [Vararia minispora EC-137]